VFINNTDLADALAALKNLPDVSAVEESAVETSCFRVSASAVFAKYSSPFYNASAMDGIAVTAKITSSASIISPMTLFPERDFVFVNTGTPVNDPFDAVIMIEDIVQLDDGSVRISAPAPPFQHIRPVGEDIVEGGMVIPMKHVIKPYDVAAMITAGIDTVKLFKKPVTAIIPTGSELVDKAENLTQGKIVESNSHMLIHMVEENGGIAKKFSPVNDNYESIKGVILSAVESCDIVIINAGSSAGTEDYSVKILEEVGKVLIHGVAIKPGKPVIIAVVNNKPVFCLPGYPVSAFITYNLFVKPYIFRVTGRESDEATVITARLTKRIVSSFKHTEYIRVNTGYINGGFIASPASGGAGSLMSLVRSGGILEIPRSCEGVEKNSMVQITLLEPETAIKDRVISIGSHDMVMDILSDYIPISSSNFGSMGGILSLLNNDCHIAPIHLLDESSGIYNISYVKKYFPSKKMALIKGLKRIQGIMTAPENPLGITDISGIAKLNCRFINRQKGSGTRILLDYLLKQNGINPDDINGYGKEVYTHSECANAVKNGFASAAVGVYSAAFFYGLNFIEAGVEDYDFLTSFDNLQDDKVQRFIAALKNPEFLTKVESLGGYMTDGIAEIIIVE